MYDMQHTSIKIEETIMQCRNTWNAIKSLVNSDGINPEPSCTHFLSPDFSMLQLYNIFHNSSEKEAFCSILFTPSPDMQNIT